MSPYFTAIRNIIAAREHHRVVPIRTDDGAVEGLLDTDGQIYARRFSPWDLAAFIHERQH